MINDKSVSEAKPNSSNYISPISDGKSFQSEPNYPNNPLAPPINAKTVSSPDIG